MKATIHSLAWLPSLPNLPNASQIAKFRVVSTYRTRFSFVYFLYIIQLKSFLFASIIDNLNIFGVKIFAEFCLPHTGYQTLAIGFHENLFSFNEIRMQSSHISLYLPYSSYLKFITLSWNWRTEVK